MSRLGKKPILVPAGISVKITDSSISIKGSKGELTFIPHPHVKIEAVDGGKALSISVANSEVKLDRSLWGLTHKLIRNMMEGVTAGFSKSLELVGIGFKVTLSGNKLNLDLGFSHPVTYELPKNIDAKIEKNIVTISGMDKQLVGQVAAEIRKLRKPEPYKGKGIRYVGEVVRQKAGKAAKTGAAAK